MRRLRPSPAAAIAVLALFVSLGGTTYAVTALPRDSVGPAQIRDRAVTEDELGNRAVISRKLATGAVVPRTIAPRSITGSRIATNALGGAQVDESLLGRVPLAQDAERAKLADRAAVADRVDHAARAGVADRAVAADTAALADRAKDADRADRANVADALEGLFIGARPLTIAETDDERQFSALCPSDRLPTGGGFLRTDGGGDPVYLASSAPLLLDDGTGWTVGVINLDDTGGPATGLLYVHCVKVEGG